MDQARTFMYVTISDDKFQSVTVLSPSRCLGCLTVISLSLLTEPRQEGLAVRFSVRSSLKSSAISLTFHATR